MHLHSSMDRFEEYNCSALQNEIDIYIPVWIDLKRMKIRVTRAFNDIYIPVWIDLKEILQNSDLFNTIIYIPVWIDLKSRLTTFL